MVFAAGSAEERAKRGHCAFCGVACFVPRAATGPMAGVYQKPVQFHGCSARLAVEQYNAALENADRDKAFRLATRYRNWDSLIEGHHSQKINRISGAGASAVRAQARYNLSLRKVFAMLKKQVTVTLDTDEAITAWLSGSKM